MARYRIREGGYKFIRNGKATELKVVDDSDKDFDGQRYKFHPTPLDAETEEEAEKGVKPDEVTPAMLKTMKRGELLELLTKVRGKDGTKPDIGMTKTAMLIEIADVLGHEDLLQELTAAE